MRTHYDNLHVSEKASAEVIRAAYKALVQKWHPDKHPNQREKAERYFKIISRAFEILSDQESRAAYDAWLEDQRSTDKPIPEVEPAKEPPQPKPKPQPNPAMADAWEDGRRSREQGLSAKDCPYAGEFAEAWQKGFAASTEKGSETLSTFAKSTWPASLWRGEEGLVKTFWLYGALGTPLVLLASFVLSILMAEDTGDMPSIIRFAQNFYLSYFIFISICIWRAAGQIRPMSGWAISARALCLTPLYGIVLAFIIPQGPSAQDKTTEKNHASAPAHETTVSPATPSPALRATPSNSGQQTAASPIQQSTSEPPQSAEDLHSQQIYAAHPDTSTLSNDPAFLAWVSKSAETNRIAKDGTAEEVIAMISAYKAYRANQYSAAVPATIAPINPYPDCEIKPVMTNEDYRVCGITSPSR